MTNPDTHTTLSREAAIALLATLSAEHGEGFLAALLGAAFVEDVARAKEDRAEDGETDPDMAGTFSDDWFVGFAEHPAFAMVADEEMSAVF